VNGALVSAGCSLWLCDKVSGQVFCQERVGKEHFFAATVNIYIHIIQSIYCADLMLSLLLPWQLTRLVCCIIIIVCCTAPQNTAQNSTKKKQAKR